MTLAILTSLSFSIFQPTMQRVEWPNGSLNTAFIGNTVDAKDKERTYLGVAGADGTNRKVIIGNLPYAECIAMSPDGNWISHDNPSTANAYLLRNGTFPRLLPATTYGEVRPLCFSADSKTLFLGGDGVFAYDLVSHTSKKVAPHSSYAGSADRSGRYLAYATYVEGEKANPHVMLKDLQSSNITKLAQGGNPIFLHNSDEIAYVSKGRIRFMTMQGAEIRSIPLTDRTYLSGIDRDDRYIYARTVQKNPWLYSSTVVRIDAMTGVQELLNYPVYNVALP